MGNIGVAAAPFGSIFIGTCRRALAGGGLRHARCLAPIEAVVGYRRCLLIGSVHSPHNNLGPYAWTNSYGTATVIG